jgi:vacuolar-type H+-ATPase subunit H
MTALKEIKQAETDATLLRENAKKESEKLLEKAYKTAEKEKEKILEQTRKKITTDFEQSVEDAKKEIQTIKKEGKNTIDQLKKNAQKKIPEAVTLIITEFKKEE